MRIKPSDIRYSQNSINNVWGMNSFHANEFIGETLDDICEKRCNISQIPKISVAKDGGRWVTADNRRLWVFKNLERLGRCEEIDVVIVPEIPLDKRTSVNDGVSIVVRRDPRGIWHLKPDATKEIAPVPSTTSLFAPFSRDSESFRSVAASERPDSESFRSFAAPVQSDSEASLSRYMHSCSIDRPNTSITTKPPITLTPGLHESTSLTGNSQSPAHYSQAQARTSDWSPSKEHRELANRIETGPHTKEAKLSHRPTRTRSKLLSKYKQLGYTSSQISPKHESFVVGSFQRIRRYARRCCADEDTLLMVEVTSKRFKRTRHIQNSASTEEIVTKINQAMDENGIPEKYRYEICIDTLNVFEVVY